MQIYLARNQVQAGPYTLDQLNKMLATQQVELNDLMWHEGMEQWQRVGSLTNETYHYNPTASATSSTRVSVAELYGNNEPDKAKAPFKTNLSPFKKQNEPSHVTRVRPDGLKTTVNELASISSRILAVLIDQILAILCLVPLLSGLAFDFDKVQEAAKDPALLSSLIETVPQYLTAMTAIFLLLLFLVQIFMLIKRGQSIGKLVTGVRILDVETEKLPTVTNIVLLRTILTNLAYNIPYLGQFILMADVFMLIINKKRRSLHDKLAKTIVVKATDSQVNKD